MTVTVHINPTLESQIFSEAQRIGITPEKYVSDVLSRHMSKVRQYGSVSKEESRLLKEINLGFSEETWQHYQALIQKRQAETLSKAEHGELIALTDRLEQANARRFKALARLTRLRNTSLDSLMLSLGLKQPEVV